jgi:hypothetical protein
MRRIPQPPVQPARRDLEHHDFWPGLIVVVIGIVLLVCGARNLTGVETTDGGGAWETQLVKAFSTSGLKYPSGAAPPPPAPQSDDPAASAAALDQWAKQNALAAAPAWKVRVDLGAKTPCPT